MTHNRTPIALLAALLLCVSAGMATADNAKGAGDLLRPQAVLIEL